MSMVAVITLMDQNNREISSTQVTSEHYLDVSCERFVENSWRMADKIASTLSEGDDFRLTMNIDLDLRDYLPNQEQGL